jgi:ketosteroid isomerase-like protein
VAPDAPLADVEREALHHPVFLLESAFEQEGGGPTRWEESLAAEASGQDNEADIKRILEGGVAALRARDIEGVMSIYAPEVVTFDIVPPLRYRGAEALRKLWEAVFFVYQGPIEYELHDLSITAGDDVAFTSSLNRLSGTLNTGQKTALWLRWTACFRKIGGTWLIVHHQNSVPVDMETGRAVLDLKP